MFWVDTGAINSSKGMIPKTINTVAQAQAPCQASDNMVEAGTRYARKYLRSFINPALVQAKLIRMSKVAHIQKKSLLEK
jgi:hypothetical protein